MTDLITFTTDFGLRDGFAGVMKGVILSINPEARFIDITHEIEPQNIQQGAFLLANSIPYFPAAAIHVCVVDPGVGSKRRALAIQVGETTFIGPDNGVLSLAVRAVVGAGSYRPEIAAGSARPGAGEESPRPRAFELNNPHYWRPRVSTTFHGRDVFSPSAAHLSRGVPLSELGRLVDDWITLAPPAPVRRDGMLVGHVIYIDRYGNIVSDITERDLEAFGSAPVIEIAGHHLHGLVRTYSDVEPGGFAALIGSPWKLEVAQREGNAAEALDVRVGDEIIVRASHK